MIYTIGHSNMTQKSFVDILKSFKIDIVVDVRSSPYSKFVSHFNREDIKRSLIENGMRYIFLGDYIGGKPRDKKYYENGKVNYMRVAQGDRYSEGADYGNFAIALLNAGHKKEAKAYALQARPIFEGINPQLVEMVDQIIAACEQ